MPRSLALVTLLLAACSSSSSGGPPDAPLVADARVASDAPVGGADARALDAPAGPDARVVDAPAGPDARAPDAMTSTGQATAFRANTLLLRDPHALFLGCSDITDPPGFLGQSVNGTIATTMTTDDDDPDNFLDLSILLVHRPLSESAATSPAELVFANCTTPVAGTSCSAGPMTTRFPGTFTNQAAGTCLSTIAGTVSDGSLYIEDYPPIGTTAAAARPCFVSDTQTLTIPVAGAAVTLSDARIAARYSDTGHVAGLVRGFISEADADKTLIPLPIFGDTPISELLWGGTNNDCEVMVGDPTPGDMDIGPDGHTLGWYFYLNFTAVQVPFQDL